MRRTAFAALAALLLAAPLFAQPQVPVGPAQRPTFSPYLNLLNRGNNPGLNYLGIVRPQMQLQQQFNQLQQQQNQQFAALGQAYDSQLDTLAGAFLPPTGNVATFGNLGGYFGRIPTGNIGGFGGYGASRFGGVGSYGGAAGLNRPSYAGGMGAGLGRAPGGRR
jgi:hypothetical protein